MHRNFLSQANDNEVVEWVLCSCEHSALCLEDNLEQGSRDNQKHAEGLR